MKFLVSSISIFLLSFAACLYLPWWSIAIMSFIVGALIYQKPWAAFLAAFVSVFILWAAMAVYISYKNENVLIHKISLVILSRNSPFGLVFLTGIIGALVAGFAALTGTYLRRIKSSVHTAVPRKSEQPAGGPEPNGA